MAAATKTRKAPAKKGLSPEEREARFQAVRERLENKVEALLDSGEWMAYLKFTASFHQYSLNNRMLIFAQMPSATYVAGYQDWLKKGRQVRKGETGLKVFGWAGKKITETDKVTGKETERIIPLRPPILSVFDVSQTDPIEGKGHLFTHPAQRLEGEDEHGIAELVAGYLATIGWTCEFEAIPGETNGYTTLDGTKRVAIEETLSPAQSAKTHLHEAAHVLLHTDDGERAADAHEHRGAREVEAESVAYVVAEMFGLNTEAYSVGYLAGWCNGDVELVKESAANVLKAVRILADAICPPEPVEDEPAPAE